MSEKYKQTACLPLIPAAFEQLRWILPARKLKSQRLWQKRSDWPKKPTGSVFRQMIGQSHARGRCQSKTCCRLLPVLTSCQILIFCLQCVSHVTQVKCFPEQTCLYFQGALICLKGKALSGKRTRSEGKRRRFFLHKSKETHHL